MIILRDRLGYSERRICRVIGQARSSQRYRSRPSSDEHRLIAETHRLALRWPRFGYSDAIRHAKVAMQTGTLKGVLWHQGESDTVTQEKADAYEKRLHRLVEDVRKDLGDAKLPFIVGNLAEFYGTGKDHNAPDRVARISKIRGILRNLPDKMPHTGFVESTGCSPATARAKVHFNRKSCILLGKRYAKIYADLTTKANKSMKATP